MPEGLKIIVGADVSEAESKLKTLVSSTHDSGEKINQNLTTAFRDLQRQGVVSLGSIDSAIKQLKQSLNVAQAPEDIYKINKAISFLEQESKNLKSIGLDTHFDKITRASQATSSASLGLAKVIDLFPGEVSHLTHSFDSLLQSYEKIRSSTDSTQSALSSLFKSFATPIGIGIVISGLVELVSQLFETDSGFSSAEISAAKFSEALGQISNNINTLKENLDFKNDISKLNAQISGISGKNLDILDIKNRRESSIQLIQTEDRLQSSLKKQRDEIIKNVSATASLGFNTQKFISILTNFKAGDKIPEALVGGLKDGEKEIVSQYNSIISQIDDSQKRSIDAQKQIGKDFLDIQRLNLELQKENLDKSTSDYQKYVNEIISKGKSFASELEKIGFVVPEFKFFDSISVQFEKAKKLINDFNSGALKLNPQAFNSDIVIQAPTETKVNEQISVFEDAIKKGLLDAPPVEVPTDFTLQEQRNAALELEFRKKFEQSGLKFTVPIGFDLKGTSTTNERLFTEQMNKQLKELHGNLQLAQIGSEALASSFQSLFIAISKGQDPIKAFFQTLSQLIIQAISELIAAALRAFIFKAILGGVSGGISLGVSGIASSLANPGFAEGGFTGYGGKNEVAGIVHKGEYVIPSDVVSRIGIGNIESFFKPSSDINTSASIPGDVTKFRSALSGISSSQQLVKIKLEGRLRGKDQILQIARTSKSQTRLGA